MQIHVKWQVEFKCICMEWRKLFVSIKASPTDRYCGHYVGSVLYQFDEPDDGGHRPAGG